MPRPPLQPRPRPRLAPLAAAGLALALVGCGSASVAELPPPAEPARSPALAEPPAGRVEPAPAGDPAPPQPPRSATVLDGAADAVVLPRERAVELRDARTGEALARAHAGVGPTTIVSDGADRLWVVDTQGDALLVFAVGPHPVPNPELELERRVHLPDSPYAVAHDPGRYRLWVTLTGDNRLAELPAHGRPHVLGTLPTVRQPDVVAVDPATGEVVVTGRDERQRVDP